MRQILSTLVLGSIFFAAAARAEKTSDPQKTLSPYFLIEGGDPKTDRLPLEHTAVTIAVSGVIADIRVHQIYRNDGSRPIHARYVFPASTRAAVHGLKMVIGEEVIEARIKEREAAKQEFEQAKREGKNASLLEEDRPNVFSMQIANLMPGQEITVELSYTENLVPQAGTYELVFPTVVGPRYSTQAAEGAAASERFVASGYTRAGVAPKATFELVGLVSAGMPIHDLASPSHKLSSLVLPDGSSAQFELDPAEARGGDRDFILRYRLAGNSVDSGLLLFEGEKESFFLLTAQPPARVAPEVIPPREYVFIVDVSGSMVGFPLDVSKQLLSDLIANLRPTDRFNVILFSGDSALMAPASLTATSENVDRAINLIDAQRGGGGTELLPALHLALSMPHDGATSRTFVVITDGYVDVEPQAMRLIRGKLGEANVFAFGIGASVNRYLIDGIARAGMGEPFVVTSREQAGDAARRFRQLIASPVLTHVHLDAVGFDVYDVEPAAIPDVLGDRPVVVFGKYRGPRRGTLTLSGQTGRGPFAKSFDLAAVAPSEQHRALPYLWARERIAALSDYGTAQGDENKDAVVALGLGYNLLTRFTSFIAVRHKVVNAGGGGDTVAQPLPMPAGVEDTAVGTESGDEPELALLALLVALAAASMLLMRGRRERAA